MQVFYQHHTSDKIKPESNTHEHFLMTYQSFIKPLLGRINDGIM